MNSRYRINLTGGTGIEAESLGSPDGIETSFTGTLSGKTTVPGSVEVTATVGASEVIISDDGKGNLSADGVTGTVDYDSGDFSLTFTTAPDDASNLTADYTRLVSPVNSVADEDLGNPEALGSTNAYDNKLRFAATTANKGIIPGTFSGTVNFSSSPVTISDDGRGNLSGDNIQSGTISYDTGEILLVFTTDPDNGAALEVDYSYVQETSSSKQLEKDVSGKFVVVVYNENESGDVAVNLSKSDDQITWNSVASAIVPVGQSRIVQIAGHMKYLRASGNGGSAVIEFKEV